MVNMSYLERDLSKDFYLINSKGNHAILDNLKLNYLDESDYYVHHSYNDILYVNIGAWEKLTQIEKEYLLGYSKGFVDGMESY